MKKYFYKIGIHFFRLYWFIFRPKGYGVKCIIENNYGEVLFIRNTYGKGYWNFPGGKIEKGETSEDAVRREVKEELGIDIAEVIKIKSFISTLEYKKDHIDVFRAVLNSPSIKIDSTEILEARWFPSNIRPEPMSHIAKLMIHK